MRTRHDHLADVAEASAAIAALAEAQPATAVPDCPELTLGGLANHLRAVQAWAAGIVAERPEGRPERDEAGPTDASAAAGLRGATATLLDALGTADPDAPCWGFGPSGTTAFWFRRQAQEALVHRHDAEVAAGVDPTPIPTAAAVEGVTEFFDSFVARWWKGGDWAGDGETCHLHATDDGDHGGEWLVTLTPEGPRLTFGHHKGDVAVRGTAEELLLGLWRRRSTADLAWFGDDADVAAWQARLTSSAF